MKTLNDLKVEKLAGTIGTKVYFIGDQLDSACMCEIKSFSVSRFGWYVTLEVDDSDGLREEDFRLNAIGLEYEKYCGIKFVVNDVYEAWKVKDNARAKAEYEAAAKRIEEAKEETISKKSIPTHGIRLMYQDKMGGGPYHVKETSDKAMTDWFQDPRA